MTKQIFILKEKILHKLLLTLQYSIELDSVFELFCFGKEFFGICIFHCFFFSDSLLFKQHGIQVAGHRFCLLFQTALWTDSSKSYILFCHSVSFSVLPNNFQTKWFISAERTCLKKGSPKLKMVWEFFLR